MLFNKILLPLYKKKVYSLCQIRYETDNRGVKTSVQGVRFG